MKHRIEHHRRMKLPPLLEIDEDGLLVSDLDSWAHRRWSPPDGDDEDGATPRDWPIELDD